MQNYEAGTPSYFATRTWLYIQRDQNNSDLSILSSRSTRLRIGDVPEDDHRRQSLS
jgi:hypothetical protein